MSALPLDEIDPLSDEILVERARSGDIAAQQMLVERYWNRIYARVYHLIRNPEDAEEVTQDAFVRALKNLDSFRGQAAFSTWLFQIATNLSYNRYWYWRRRGRGVSCSLDQSPPNSESCKYSDLFADDGPDPSHHAVSSEYFEVLEEVWRELNGKHRDILFMRVAQDLSYDEIADRLDLNVGTVKSRLARAREQMKKVLESRGYVAPTMN